MPKIVCPCTACKFNSAEDEADENGECQFPGYVTLKSTQEITDSMECQSFEWRVDE